MPAEPTRRSMIGSQEAKRALARLHGQPVNFVVADLPDRGTAGWTVEDFRQPLPPEPPGPPVRGGSWEVARRLVRDYEFADPRIVRAVYYPAAPLEGRDMLLVARFLGLRFHLGVRVGGVVDERARIEGRPVRIWGWDYKTLRGHLEAGQMDYEVWKWQDTGDVEFRIRRAARTGGIRNPLVRLGWEVFGRWMQRRFVDRACRRMDAFVRAELGLAATRPPRQAAVAVRAAEIACTPEARRWGRRR